MSQCLSICVLSRNSVLQSIPLPSDMNLHLLRVTKWLQKFTNGMFGIHSKRDPYLLNQINAPLLAYRLIPIHHYISIFPHERSNRRVETKGFQFLVRFLRKNRSYVLFFCNYQFEVSVIVHFLHHVSESFFELVSQSIF